MFSIVLVIIVVISHTESKMCLITAQFKIETDAAVHLHTVCCYYHVSHVILLSQLSTAAFTATVFDWFSSYLSGSQQIVINQKHKSISSGVPQGSVLGPLLFTLKMLLIGQIIKLYGLNFYCYADATCIKELKLVANYLKLNSEVKLIISSGKDSTSWTSLPVFMWYIQHITLVFLLQVLHVTRALDRSVR